jgi:cardiolipin synthase
MSNASLLLPYDYVADATKQVDKAQTRVVLLTMVIADHPATHSLIDALEKAAKRGVDVQVAADIFTYGEISGSFLPIMYYNKPARGVTAMVKRLRDAGVKFQWLGRARAIIFNGRTHIKWCIVDDVVYSFGGVNLFQGGTENIDYMLKQRSQELADKLVSETSRLLKADKAVTYYKSHQFEVEGNTFIIDGGILGNSLIYKRACELASEAKSVIFVSQYCPTGRLSDILKTKKSKLYFNSPENAALINRIVITWGMLRTKQKTSYKKLTYLHAKFIIFTMPDGSRVALSGSHNFNYTGVAFGTREAAIETRDPHLIDQLQKFCDTYVA